ncbi:centromere protein J-like [Pocillopora damicornis]|uniref:centromere protein J-like n=1 Tax=Pocillopora damicornis TaxID=46731 RepID=UPI000F558B59|nr:centromere protein J-like [Pocillopora damicornis]
MEIAPMVGTSWQPSHKPPHRKWKQNEQRMEENCQTEVGDEMPIKPGIGGSSQAKTFEELLEEQLKLDAEASKAATKTQSTTQKPQRTFLRKGQGLARFKGKSASAKVITKTQEPAVQLTTAQQKKEKRTGNAVAASSQGNNKSGGVSGGPVAQTKVTRKVASRSPQVMTEASVKSQQIRGSKPLKTQPASSDGKPVAIAVTRPAAMPTCVISDEPEESNPPSVFNSIDASFQMRLKELEEKQELEEEELEEFELLEQAAANASFSSNSSVVVKVLAKARGGSAQISKNNTMRGAGNKPENRGSRSVQKVMYVGAGGILSPVDTGYGSGDGKGAVSIDESRPLPVVELREPHANESEDDDSDVTLQEMSLDSALELDSGQGEKRQAAGDLQKVLAPAYLNPPSTESDNEFNDEDTWAAIKKQAGTDFENEEKGGEVDSDDDDDDEDDSDVTISDIFPLVTSTPPVALKRGQPPKSQVADAIEAERMLAASTPPTSTLVTKLFPQLKPKQKAAPAVAKQATSDVPKAQGQEEEPVDTVQSAAVREKLKELEAEIEKFRTENAALAKIRKEREEGLKKLQAEIAAFEKQKTDELERLEQFREEEMRKLRRERRVFEKYQKAARSMPDKKEREEIESLREQMADLQEELKRRESRWSAASTRSRQKIEVLEEQNKELQEEVKLLEHYRLQQWREEEQAKAKEEEESRPKKPLLRKTAKATEEEPGPKLPVRHRPPPMRAALAEVLPRSTPETATIDPETRLPSAAIQLDKNNNQSSSSRQDENTPSDVLYNEKEEISSALKPVDDNNHDTMKSKRSPRRRSKTPERGEKFKRNVHFQDEEKYDENNVEKVNSDGSRVISFANGTRKDISVDGQTITVTFFNGDVKQIMPDQRVMYYYSDVQTTHTTYPDGLEVLQFPSKQIEKHYPDGTKEIIFPDQTIKYLYPNGAEECVFSDGTIQKVSVDGERTIEFPNGQRETHTKFYKKREYPDGTVKTVYPDGRTETRYASGRVRVKDREGRILVDAPHQDR